MSDETDRGRLLGEGLFETVLVVGGVAPQLERHVERMRRSGVALGVPVPPGLIDAARASLRELWAAAGRPHRAALRVTVTSCGGRGLVPPPPLVPHVTVTLDALPDAPPGPARVVVVNAHRVDPTSALTGHKTTSWLGWVLARREALERGADVALVRTVDGDVCEADHANLFLVLEGRIVTPGLDRGVLPGITRERVLAALRRAGVSPTERAIARVDLGRAREIFLTSSLSGVRAVSRCDGREVPEVDSVAAWLGSCLEAPGDRAPATPSWLVGDAGAG